jgi:hypothetical protein
MLKCKKYRVRRVVHFTVLNIYINGTVKIFLTTVNPPTAYKQFILKGQCHEIVAKISPWSSSLGLN